MPWIKTAATDDRLHSPVLHDRAVAADAIACSSRTRRSLRCAALRGVRRLAYDCARRGSAARARRSRLPRAGAWDVRRGGAREPHRKPHPLVQRRDAAARRVPASKLVERRRRRTATPDESPAARTDEVFVLRRVRKADGKALRSRPRCFPRHASTRCSRRRRARLRLRHARQWPATFRLGPRSDRARRPRTPRTRGCFA